MRIEYGFEVKLKGDVGDVRRWWSLLRICGGKVVVFGAQSVLSLSRTRARIVGFFWGVEGFSVGVGVDVDALVRCGPRSSGRCVKVGIVRCGRNWEGCLRRVYTAWLKPRRLELGEPAIVGRYVVEMYVLLL